MVAENSGQPVDRPLRVAVTGTSRGLGQALAAELTRLGHQVAGCSSATVDVRSAAAVEEWAARVGEVDLLLNNAGVALPPEFLWRTEPADFEKVIATNLTGVFLVARAFLPGMLRRGRGVIANFTSDWGRTVSPLYAAYCASKFGVEGLTRALAEELPAGVAAVLVDPGDVNTDMLRLAVGEEASAAPGAAEWAARAAPRLLALSPHDNGQTLRLT